MANRQELANAIRALAMDAVQKANSGHPGMPMGMADIAEVIWNHHLRFNPRNPGALRAEVFFIIRRDGSIGEFRFLTKSGVYAFDLEAQGAIESAGSAKAFGALPPGYVNDFLPVIFSFDPSLIR